MKNRLSRFRWASLFALSVVPHTAFAENEPKVDVRASVFAHWKYDLKPTPYEGYIDGDPRPNAFDIDRAFLDIGSQLDETFSVRARTDVARNERGQLGLLLRNAYLQMDFAHDITLRMGAAENTMNHLAAEFWGHRWLAETFASQSGSNAEADVGIYASGSHIDGLIGWGASVVNGEGYDRIDDDYDKAVQGRLTIDPLHGDMKLPISVYISKDVYTHDDIEGQTLLIAALGFDHKYVNVWGEYVSDSTGDIEAGGMSFSVVGKIMDLFNVVGRYDTWDPDQALDDDEYTVIRAGLTKDFVARISAGVTYEQTKYVADPKQPHKAVFFRMQAGF